MHHAFPAGELNPNWRGGRTVSERGYLYVRHQGENSTRKGYIRESRLVATIVLGRELKPTEIVHHINGDISDCRKGNLVICQDQGYHLLIHRRERALSKSGNPNFMKCGHCKTYGDPNTMKRLSTRNVFYHQECRVEYDKKRRNQNGN